MSHPNYVCKSCGKDFKSYNKGAVFCTRQCKYENQTTNIDSAETVRLYESGMTQMEVAAQMNVNHMVIYKLFRRIGYKCRRAVSRNQDGSNNTAWKGDEATYASLHKRVAKKRGKPMSCSRCDKTSGRFEWANLTGNYTDVQDYCRMCVPCHRKYDSQRRKLTGILTTSGTKMKINSPSD